MARHPLEVSPHFSVAARPRIVAYCHILHRTRVLALWMMVGSPEAVSEECCLGGVCSPGAGHESEHTRETPRTKIQAARLGREKAKKSRAEGDVPSHIHT